MTGWYSARRYSMYDPDGCRYALMYGVRTDGLVLYGIFFLTRRHYRTDGERRLFTEVDTPQHELIYVK